MVTFANNKVQEKKPMNCHYLKNWFSILNKILIISSMLLGWQKIILLYVADRNINLLNLMVCNLVIYIKSVHMFYPMISFLHIPKKQPIMHKFIWKSIGTRKFSAVYDKEIWEGPNSYQDKLILVHLYNRIMCAPLKVWCNVYSFVWKVL